MSTTKYLTFNEPKQVSKKKKEDAPECVVQVHDSDEKLPGTFLGTFVHEDGLDPFFGPRRDQLDQHVFKLLRDKYPNEADQINRDSVTIEPAYDLPLAKGEQPEEPKTDNENVMIPQDVQEKTAKAEEKAAKKK